MTPIGGKFHVDLAPDWPDWLRRMRTARKLNITEMAQKMDVNPQTYRSLEMGKTGSYYIGLFQILADTLGIELGYVLHKAGFDVGREGLNSVRLQRAEAVADAFAGMAEQIRSAMAEAMNALDPKLPVAADRPNERAIDNLGRALGLLDLAEGRLRDEGFLGRQAFQISQDPVGVNRRWTDEEYAYLEEHDEMSEDELASRLGRTVAAVRIARHRRRKTTRETV
jgi:transcriptional regulator with XRE-family HTH domain